MHLDNLNIKTSLVDVETMPIILARVEKSSIDSGLKWHYAIYLLNLTLAPIWLEK